MSGQPSPRLTPTHLALVHTLAMDTATVLASASVHPPAVAAEVSASDTPQAPHPPQPVPARPFLVTIMHMLRLPPSPISPPPTLASPSTPPHCRTVCLSAMGTLPSTHPGHSARPLPSAHPSPTPPPPGACLAPPTHTPVRPVPSPPGPHRAHTTACPTSLLPCPPRPSACPTPPHLDPHPVHPTQPITSTPMPLACPTPGADQVTTACQLLTQQCPLSQPHPTLPFPCGMMTQWMQRTWLNCLTCNLHNLNFHGVPILCGHPTYGNRRSIAICAVHVQHGSCFAKDQWNGVDGYYVAGGNVKLHKHSHVDVLL